jgi:hypothetical protein
MKISCDCGALILDITDHLPNKGHVFGDRDWFEMLDLIDRAIENPPSKTAKQETAVQIRQTAKPRLAYECIQCGRLYLAGADHTLIEFVPANRRYNAVLDR